MFFFDPLYFLFMVPPLIFMLYAQFKVNSTFKKYSQVMNTRRMTGLDAARTLLNANGLNTIQLEGAKGKLSDHYDPGKKVLRLSADVANSASVASLGIVAHEVGHAVQDKAGYAFMKLRSAFVPVANLGSTFGYICVILGFMIYIFSGSEFGTSVVLFGILLFSLAVIFSLITLPVEFDASNRARKMLQSTGLVSVQELNGASAVLSAAALTYVAATLQAVAQLLYYVFMFMGMRNRD
jgi:uncharacterized protein